MKDGSVKTQPEPERRTSIFEDESVEDKLVKFIATTHSSLNLVDNLAFQDFARSCPKDYKFPSRKKLTNLVEMKAAKHTLNTKKEMEDAKALSLTTDIWTSPKSKMSFLAITGVSVSHNFTKKNFLVDLIPMEVQERHTAEYIQSLLEHTIERMEINTSKVFSIVADGGANIKKGITQTGLNYVNCAAHLLNCYMQDVSKMEPLNGFVQRIQKLVQLLHSSHVIYAKWINFCETHGVTVREINGIVSTRWNSLHMTLCDVLNALDPIQDLLLDLKMTPFSQTEVNFLCLARNAFSVFFELTEEFCHSEATISTLVPGLVFAEKEVARLAAEIGISARDRFFMGEMLRLFKNRFGETIQDKQLCRHTLVDPRMAFSTVFSDGKWSEILNDFFAVFQETADVVVCEEVYEEVGNRTIWDSFQVNNNNTTSLWDELIAYKAAIRGFKNCNLDPLKFWKTRAQQFPLLSSVAAKLLVTPATSADCERLFSGAGIIFGNKRRQRLSGMNTRNLLIVATSNRKEIDYSRRWNGRYSSQAYEIVDSDYEEEYEDMED